MLTKDMDHNKFINDDGLTEEFYELVQDKLRFPLSKMQKKQLLKMDRARTYIKLFEKYFTCITFLKTKHMFSIVLVDEAVLLISFIIAMDRVNHHLVARILKRTVSVMIY